MITLKELEELGVKELRISGGEAVAVNPYERYDYTPDHKTIGVNSDWFHFNSLNLSPLPCHESVKEGTYPIGRFKEQTQFYFEGGAKFGPARWVDCTKDRDYSNKETRLCLVLSEPVAEKPEGEMTRLPFGSRKPKPIWWRN